MEKLKTEFNPRVVKALMALHNETQEDLAKAIGYSTFHLSRVLSGQRKGTIKLAASISKHYRTEQTLFFSDLSCINAMKRD